MSKKISKSKAKKILIEEFFFTQDQVDAILPIDKEEQFKTHVIGEWGKINEDNGSNDT